MTSKKRYKNFLTNDKILEMMNFTLIDVMKESMNFSLCWKIDIFPIKTHSMGARGQSHLARLFCFNEIVNVIDSEPV